MLQILSQFYVKNCDKSFKYLFNKESLGGEKMEERNKIYLTNGFSPSMIPIPADVSFKEVTREEFCEAAKKAINSIGHSGTVSLVNSLCGTNLNVNRISIKTSIGDSVYMIVLTVRLEEGKVLGAEEMEQLLKEGKIRFIKASIYGSVLEELADCYGRCDERQYDSLAFKAKGGQ